MSGLRVDRAPTWHPGDMERVLGIGDSRPGRTRPLNVQVGDIEATDPESNRVELWEPA